MTSTRLTLALPGGAGEAGKAGEKEIFLVAIMLVKMTCQTTRKQLSCLEASQHYNDSLTSNKTAVGGIKDN